jgi:GTP cyclohydrolase I
MTTTYEVESPSFGDPTTGEYAVDVARTLFTALGIRCDDELTRHTPRRFVQAILDLTSGIAVDPDRHLSVTFPPAQGDPVVICVVQIPFTSLCEHHLLPFIGHAAIAYLPAPQTLIVHLSKLARLLCEDAARPQVQEQPGNQVVAAITTHLDTQRAACELRATHACTTLRGARGL